MCAKRKRNEKKLIFSNEFFSDMEQDGMLYAALIRSPVSDATLNSISHPKLPEGYAIFSAKDIIGKKTIQTLNNEIPVFCTGELRYIGEPLGILVGTDENKVRELINGVEIRYEERMHDNKELLAKRTVVTNPKIDELLASADFLIEETWFPHIHPKNYNEPNGAFCYTKNGLLYIYTPTQWLRHMRESLAAVTGMDINDIVINRTQISELDTNTLWIDSQIAAQVSTAVLKTGKAVKLVLSREEQQQFIENAAPLSITHKTAVNFSGEIIADDITITVDGGAYNPFAQEFVDRLCIASCNVYNPKALRITGMVSSSAYPPYSINLSTIDSHAIFAVENQIQKIAAETGLDPIELREKNYSPAAQAKISTPFQLHCEKAPEALSAVCRSSDFSRKYTSYRLHANGRYQQNNNSPFAPPVRGIGLACGFSGSGYNGTRFSSSRPSMEITLKADGTLCIHALPTSLSIWNIWKKLVSTILGIDESKVMLNSDFPIGKEPEMPESAISNVSILTALLKSACESMRRKRDSAELPLTIKKTLSQSRKTPWNKELFAGTPFVSTAFASCVMEVELDTCTYREQVRGIWIVVDAGKIFNVKAAESTIKSTIQQTLQEIIDNDVIRCPNIRVQFIQSSDESKQIDGVVRAVLPAAFTAALSQALATTVNHLPIQIDTLYTLSQKAKEAFEERQAAERKAKEEKAKEEKTKDEKAKDEKSKDEKAAEQSENSDSQEKAGKQEEKA